MKTISEKKWWRVAKASYNAPTVEIYEKDDNLYFSEMVFDGDFIYSRIRTIENQYCVRSHKDEWRKPA